MVLHQCIRPRVGAHAPGYHGNPRAPDLISGDASKGYSGHQFSDALERPFLHLFFFSRRPWWGNDRGAYIAALLVMSSSLMVTNTAAGSHSLGRRSELKVTIAMENAPGDAGDFIGERNR